MDENTKLMKSVMILNIITVVVVVVLLGLQVYQIVTVKPYAGPAIDQQKQSPATQPQSGITPKSGGTPMGQQMPSGQQQSGLQNEKCGDGICDAMEKANPNLCAKDC